MLFGRQDLIKGILWNIRIAHVGTGETTITTIERIMTHGKFKEVTMAIAKEVLPEPELPAIPMILVLTHGGE